MSSTPLFSSYGTGENRVTAAMLAVLARVEGWILQRLIASLAEDAAVEVVRFQNQVAEAGVSGVPDAQIRSNVHYLFEVKVQPGGVNAAQLRRHLKHFTGDAGVDERLFVLTPDAGEPAAVTDVDDPRVIWANFRLLDQAIVEVVDSADELVGERSEFLLRELRALLDAEGLLYINDVVVVAAKDAYPEYADDDYAAYVCQPGRHFRPGVQRLGFYTHGQIKPELPRIRAMFDNVAFTEPASDAAEQATGIAGDSTQTREDLGKLIERVIEDQARPPGPNHKVLLLEPSDEAFHLDAPIDNDTTAASGRPWAWTLGQRYTSLNALRRARTTSDL